MVVPTACLIKASPSTTQCIPACIDAAKLLSMPPLIPCAPRECGEQKELETELWHSVWYVVEIQGSQMAALRLGDKRTGRFEEEITAALQGFQRARKSYMEHVEEHGC